MTIVIIIFIIIYGSLDFDRPASSIDLTTHFTAYSVILFSDDATFIPYILAFFFLSQVNSLFSRNLFHFFHTRPFNQVKRFLCLLSLFSTIGPAFY